MTRRESAQLTRASSRVGLGTHVLVLLLLFGAIPLAAAIGIGYAVSRSIITDQAVSALRELGRQQAVHLATELRRERLLLRTITGHLGSPEALRRLSSQRVAEMLEQSLPEDGVFDGLRLVTTSGVVVASVSLRHGAPDWPSSVPAANWSARDLEVHWRGARAVAYLLAAPVSGSDGTLWLEGHVRSDDFNRLFAIPTHLMGEVESAVVANGGRSLFVSHDHVHAGLPPIIASAAGDSAAVERTTLDRRDVLVVTSVVPGTDWVFGAALPLDDALAPLADFRNAAFLVASVLVLLIVATAVLATRSISMPLRELAASARRFGRGESVLPVRSSGTAEVGQLVTAFNQMADDLQRSRAEILRLHEQDMERAQQLATVGEMASGIAHEVRNPLTGVLGALDLALKRLEPDDPGRPLLEEAQQQLRRIEGTTTQLLRYARPPTLREVVVEPRQLVERAVRVVESNAHAAGITLRVEHSPETVNVRVDPELMVQVLLNLMLNGIDAMREGADLTVWTTVHSPDVWIGVRDTGPGVPEDIRAEIFRPFYTTKNQGSGLGLPISRQIVERHGGRLRLEETPGGGATFIVELPLIDREGDEP